MRNPAVLQAGRHYGPGGGRALEALHAAREDQATAMQVFAGGNRTRKVTAPPEADAAAFRDLSAGMYLTIHAAYVINTAQPLDSELSLASREHLITALEWGERLEFDSVLFHPGSSKEHGREAGNRFCAQAVIDVMTRYEGPVRLLLENSAGDAKDRVVGRDLDELAAVCDAARAAVGDRVGLCVDTAHAFPAGYTVPEIAQLPARYPPIEVVHLNAPKADITLGSRKDRHEVFEQGAFTMAELELMVRGLAGLPLILESSPPSDLQLVRQWATGQ